MSVGNARRAVVGVIFAGHLLLGVVDVGALVKHVADEQALTGHVDLVYRLMRFGKPIESTDVVVHAVIARAVKH